MRGPFTHPINTEIAAIKQRIRHFRVINASVSRRAFKVAGRKASNPVKGK